MLNDILELLQKAGAPEDLVHRPLPFYTDLRTGAQHGESDCVGLPTPGEGWEGVELMHMPAIEASGCECVEAALDKAPELEELLGVAEDAQDLLVRLADISPWKEWLATSSRSGTVVTVDEGLLMARNLLTEIRDRIDGASHSGEWLEKWYARLEADVRKVNDDFVAALSAPENRERLVSEAVVETFYGHPTHSDVERLAIGFGPEILEFLGEEREHPSPQIEWVLREAYGLALASNLEEGARRERLHSRIVEHRPTVLTSEMFPFTPAFLPKEGQTVQEWLEDLWDEEAKDLARLTDVYYQSTVEELRSTLCLAVLENSGTHEVREATIVYRRHKVHGHTVLVLPEAVARELTRHCNPRNMGRGHFQWVALREGDTDTVVETAVGLYDPYSPVLRDIEKALEAARLV